MMCGKKPIEEVPVVDFNAYSLGVRKKEVNEQDYKKLAVDLHAAFSTIGFVYLKNHGIPQEHVSLV